MHHVITTKCNIPLIPLKELHLPENALFMSRFSQSGVIVQIQSYTAQPYLNWEHVNCVYEVLRKQLISQESMGYTLCDFCMGTRVTGCYASIAIAFPKRGDFTLTIQSPQRGALGTVLTKLRESIIGSKKEKHVYS